MHYEIHTFETAEWYGVSVYGDNELVTNQAFGYMLMPAGAEMYQQTGDAQPVCMGSPIPGLQAKQAQDLCARLRDQEAQRLSQLYGNNGNTCDVTSEMPADICDSFFDGY